VKVQLNKGDVRLSRAMVGGGASHPKVEGGEVNRMIIYCLNGVEGLKWPGEPASLGFQRDT